MRPVRFAGVEGSWHTPTSTPNPVIPNGVREVRNPSALGFPIQRHQPDELEGAPSFASLSEGWALTIGHLVSLFFSSLLFFSLLCESQRPLRLGVNFSLSFLLLFSFLPLCPLCSSLCALCVTVPLLCELCVEAFLLAFSFNFQLSTFNLSYPSKHTPTRKIPHPICELFPTPGRPTSTAVPSPFPQSYAPQSPSFAR